MPTDSLTLIWSLQGQNSGPMMHGMGQQGPNNKGKAGNVQSQIWVPLQGPVYFVFLRFGQS